MPRPSSRSSGRSISSRTRRYELGEARQAGGPFVPALPQRRGSSSAAGPTSRGSTAPAGGSTSTATSSSARRTPASRTGGSSASSTASNTAAASRSSRSRASACTSPAWRAGRRTWTSGTTPGGSGPRRRTSWKAASRPTGIIRRTGGATRSPIPTISRSTGTFGRFSGTLSFANTYNGLRILFDGGSAADHPSQRIQDDRGERLRPRRPADLRLRRIQLFHPEGRRRASILPEADPPEMRDDMRRDRNAPGRRRAAAVFAAAFSSWRRPGAGGGRARRNRPRPAGDVAKMDRRERTTGRTSPSSAAIGRSPAPNATSRASSREPRPSARPATGTGARTTGTGCASGVHCGDCHTPSSWKNVPPNAWDHETMTGFRREGHP